MFLETLRRGLHASLIKFRFTITVIICLLLAITTTLIGDESDDRQSEKDEAFETICQLSKGERQISWGYLGAYGTSPNKTNQRVAFWWDSLDSFLSKAPDTEIANLASLFAESNVIAILRQLVEGKKISCGSRRSVQHLRN
jgi:hypothetical protein